MPLPRKAVVSAEFIGIYHCIFRCVRRAWLCGKDPLTGKSFQHRRQLTNRNLKALASHFCLQVISSAVQPNHLHVIIKVDPFAAAALSPQDVVRRWRRIFPLQRDPQGKPVELSDDQLLKEISNPDKVELWRNRLVDLSWFRMLPGVRITGFGHSREASPIEPRPKAVDTIGQRTPLLLFNPVFPCSATDAVPDVSHKPSP